MKRFGIAVCAAVLLTATISMTQTRQGDVVADIPFVFVVAGRAMPAGHYIVSSVNDTLVRIENSTRQGGFVSTTRIQRSASDNRCRLVFHRYGDTYFLSQVWVTGNDRGREVPRSRIERELAARIGAGESVVVLRSKVEPRIVLRAPCDVPTAKIGSCRM